MLDIIVALVALDSRRSDCQYCGTVVLWYYELLLDDPLLIP